MTRPRHLALAHALAEAGILTLVATVAAVAVYLS